MRQHTAERDPATGLGRVIERPGRAGFNEGQKSRDNRRLRVITANRTNAKGAAGNRAKYA